MELIEAMDDMDDARCCDFFLQQIYYIHSELTAQWTRQHRPATPLRLPFAWVLSKTLRLLEEYPDGLTEAIVLTELTAQLHKRERRSSKRTRLRSLDERLEENDQAVVDATVVDYAQHCISMQLCSTREESHSSDTSVPPAVGTARMFLHQRFRACMATFATLGDACHAPFVPGRQLAFTDTKLLEKKTRVAGNGASVLPTPYVALRLTPSDDRLQAQALSFAQVDVMASQELPGHEAPSLLQELVVKAHVVDISAIRPCTTPYHVQRQVIMLTDATSASQVSTTATAIGSHVLILWDDQVALSRLFHVGDTLTLLHPFVHVCSQDDAEMVSVYEEYSSQQRCVYYLEYGSATTLFVSPSIAGDTMGTRTRGHRQHDELQSAEHHGDVSVAAVATHSIGFSLYGHVATIRVSHGIPLLAAFFYAYYDPKTLGRLAGTQRPSLDRAVVSKYYLVVLVELYDAASNELRSLELTGETAVRALTLRVGQTVYVEGLVAVDMRGDATIRSLRDEHAQQQHQQLTQAQDERARFAFPNRAYRSPIVALSSDWESIFGLQSDVFTASRLFAINQIPGILKTRLPRDLAPLRLSQLLAGTASSRRVALVTTRFTVTQVGWLVPSDTASFRWDESCERGFSTMLAHRACKRPLEAAPSPATASSSDLPRWKCSFCHELLVGMDATVQTYGELGVRLDDGTLSAAHATVSAIAHGDAVSLLLGVPAESFSQLSLPDKLAALRQAVGKDYSAVLSRCPRQRVVADPSSTSTASYSSSSDRATAVGMMVDLRIDQLQPVDAFATAQTLLTQLRTR